MAMMLLASVSFAIDFPAENPFFSLEGSTISMKMDLTGIAAPEFKVMWCNLRLPELFDIQPYADWFLGTGKNITTIPAMLSLGWRLTQIIPYNSSAAKQFYLVFQK